MTSGAKKIVRDVVLAGPDQFDWRFHFLCNGCGFCHVVVLEPTTKASTTASHMYGNSSRIDRKCLCNERLAFIRLLRWGPNFNSLSSHPRGTVLRLHRDVGQKRYIVYGVKGVSRRSQSGVSIPALFLHFAFPSQQRIGRFGIDFTVVQFTDGFIPYR